MIKLSNVVNRIIIPRRVGSKREQSESLSTSRFSEDDVASNLAESQT